MTDYRDGLDRWKNLARPRGLERLGRSRLLRLLGIWLLVMCQLITWPLPAGVPRTLETANRRAGVSNAFPSSPQMGVLSAPITDTPTNTATSTPTDTATSTPSPTITITPTSSPSAPPSATPSNTSTSSFTPTPTLTATPSSGSIFADGFETGDFSNWTTSTLSSTAGSVKAVVGSAAFAGAFGAELSNGVGGATGQSSSVSKTFTAPASQFVSAQTRIRVNTLTGAGTLRLFQLRDSVSGQAVVRVRYANGVAQLLLVRRDHVQVTTSFASNLSTGTWHLLELTYDWSGAQPVGQAWIDGAAQARIVDVSSGPAIVPNTVFCMVSEDVATASVDAYFDEVRVANGYIGNGSTTGTPNSTSVPTNTPTITPTSTVTLSPVGSATSLPTATPTRTASATATGTVTSTSSPTNILTATSTATATPSLIGSATSVPTASPTGTPSITPSGTPTGTAIPTSTLAASPTSTATTSPIGSATSVPTATPTQTSSATPTLNASSSPTASSTPTPTATATAASGTVFTVYADSLASGWASSGWGSTVNLASTSYVHSGTLAVSYTITNGYGAFVPALRTGSFDTTPYTNIRFWVNGEATGGQQLGLMVRFASTNINGKLIKINPYIVGGSVAAGQWRLVDLPLSVLGATNTTINRFALQDVLGTTQPSVSVDDIQFYNAASATVTPTSTMTASATSTVAPTPTITSSSTSTMTSTSSASPTPTATSSNTPTATPSFTPTATASIAPSATASVTPTTTSTDTATATSSATGTATATDTPTTSPTATATVTPTSTSPATPSDTPTPTYTISPSTTPTATPTDTATATSTVIPSNTATATLTDTATATSTYTPTTTPTDTATVTPTATSTATPSDTPTPTYTSSPSTTPTATSTFTDTPTVIPSNTGTATPSDTPTSTFTATPTYTATASPTDSATATPTQTVTFVATATPSYTATATDTATATPTYTFTATPSDTATVTPTDTVTPTATATQASTGTATSTPTDTPTVTPTNTSTATASPSDTATVTYTSSPTSTATASPTFTGTATPSDTPTITPSGTPTTTASTTSTATPTSTASQTPTVTSSPTPSSTQAAGGVLPIYSDAFATGWQSATWGATANTASTTYVHTGSYAVSYTITAAYGAFAPNRTAAPIDTSPYSNIRFWVNGEATGGQQLAFMARSTSTGTWGPLVRINAYITGGSVAAGQWRLVDLPLSVLAAANTTIDRVALQDIAGTAQPSVSVDDIEFYSTVPATATLSPTITPTATPTSTPTMTLTSSPTTTPTDTATACAPACTATNTPSSSSTPTASSTPTQATTPIATTDYTDVLEIYYSAKTQSDAGFERVSLMYGLKRADVNLATTNLTDNLLRDEVGNYYLVVFIDGAHLANLNAAQLQVLKNAVEVGGLNVLTTAFRVTSSPQMQFLTENEITGSVSVSDNSEDYIVTGSLPAVTKEFTGKTITYAGIQRDYALQLQSGASHTQVLVNSTDNNSQVYPVFASFKHAGGNIFVVSNYADMYLQWNTLSENYANSASNSALIQQWFSQITPLMMAVRYAAGNEAWHNNHNYANFTIDDEPLQMSHTYDFNWAGILQESIAHNFHVTNALIPAKAANYEQPVVDLFVNNPNRLSVVQHGNNHEGYEFYKYTVNPGDPYPAEPYDDQDGDIIQGMQRLQAFTQSTGIPHSAIMIFPFNISPPDTLTLLKKYNFQATINSLDYPLTTTRVRNVDSYMYPAEMSYNNFAVIKRFSPATSPYPFDLFLDHPTFLYSHKDFFDNFGITGLDPIADAINATYGNIEWKSLDYILKHMYLEKLNDDGTWDAKLYGNDVIISNETTGNILYHIRRDETLNVPIFAVTLDGVAVGYSVSNGQLQVDAVVPAGSSRELTIIYGSGP